MDEFRNKQSGGRRRPQSIDGMSGRPSPRFGAPKKSPPGVGMNSSNRIGNPNRLDNFARPEGLEPNRQERIVQSNRPNESIVIERRQPEKKSFFARRRAKKSGLDGLGRRKAPLTRKKKFLRGFAVFSVLIVAITGFLFAKGYINLHKVLRGGGGAAALEENVDPSRLKGEGDGRVNILFLGRGGEGHDGADLTDTIIIASIDPIQKEAVLVSLPRDLWVKVGNNGSMKINAAFSTGKEAALAKQTGRQTDASRKAAEDAGFDLLETTIQNTLGVPIHYHAMVDFAGFKQAVDTVGGIDINAPTSVKEDLWIDGRHYMLDVKPGQQHMDGFKALAYSRSRHTSARGDFDRSERQRAIIVALKDKVFSLGTFGNPQKISQLLGNFGNHVQTNFTTQDLKRLYDLSKDINGSKVTSVALVDPPHDFLTTGNINGLSVVLPKAGAGNYTEIKAYLRSVLKDSYIRNENASVMVLNGTTTPGLATTKGDELKSFGYNVTKVDNAPTKNYTKTIVVDLRNGQKKYTRNYLEKRFGTTAVGTLPDQTILPETADFVIIIGSDQVTNQ